MCVILSEIESPALVYIFCVEELACNLYSVCVCCFGVYHVVREGGRKSNFLTTDAGDVDVSADAAVLGGRIDLWLLHAA